MNVPLKLDYTNTLNKLNDSVLSDLHCHSAHISKIEGIARGNPIKKRFLKFRKIHRKTPVTESYFQ